MLKGIWKIVLHEIRMVTSDHSMLLTMLLAPVLYAFMYGSIYINKTENHVPLAIVDNDGSALSRKLSDQLASHQSLAVSYKPNLEAAEEALNKGDVNGYVYIEPGFEQKILSLQQANVTLATNAAKFLPSSDITSAVTTVCLTVGGGIRNTYFNKQGMSDAEAMANTNPIVLDYRPLYNESVGYGSFLLPGLLAIILQQTLLIGLAISMLNERKNQELKEVYRLSNNQFSSVFIGKSIFYLFAFSILAQFFIHIVFHTFNMPFRGSMPEVSSIILLLIMTIVPLAFFIGSFFKNTVLLIQILGFTSYPIFLITGYSMPLANLPFAVQCISNMLPTTPFLKAYTIMIQGGARLTDQLPAVFHLILLFMFYSVLLALRLNYLKQKSKNAVSAKQ